RSPFPLPHTLPTQTSTLSLHDALPIFKGAAHFYKDRGKHLVTVKTEHKATLDTMRELEREGYEVTYLDVEPNGLVDFAKFEAALDRKSTRLNSSHRTISYAVFCLKKKN